MKRVIIGLLLCLVIPVLVVSCLVLFGTENPPQTDALVTNPFTALDYSGLPSIEHYPARDGTKLSFRTYAAEQKQIAILIHGSAGSSSDMHALAKALQASGVTVYVPDLRGHGANYPRGDVAYAGQLDDDLADFIGLEQLRHQSSKWTLLGFSSGGGFALRIAAGPLGRSFGHYILLAPFLRYNAPTVRTATPESGGQAAEKKQVWSTVSTGRIIGLRLLGAIGIHWFDGLPVIHFAVPPNVSSVTASYSWRMQQSFQPHDDFRADIRAVSEPLQVFVGEEDQLFLPEKFKDVFDAERSEIPVSILPGLGHSEMVTSPQAIRAVVAAFRE
jgi:non-heme chloroperoxidase